MENEYDRYRQPPVHEAIPTINGDIHNIGTSSGCSNHTGGSYTRGVVRVNMDRNIWVSLPNGADEAIKSKNPN